MHPAGTTITRRHLPPARGPRLAPHAAVLQREGEEVQVGFDPDSALVFRGSSFGALLASLDGQHTLPEVRAVGRAAGLPARQIDATLRALSGARLLLEPGLLTGERVPSPGGPEPEGSVRLVGAGPIGRLIAHTLLGSAVARLYVFDPEPPELALYPVAGARASRAEALRAELPNTETGSVTVLNHWSKPDTGRIDLTLVVLDGPEVDRMIAEHLIRLDQPHLLVRSFGDGACVGPLVVPGRTSCVRCADLARRDADPQWPIVLAQLTRLRLPLAPALVAWAAATAVAQALAFLAGALPESAGATLELREADFVMRRRSWQAHAECGCGWVGTTEWGP